jgi:hypothetical protein
MAMIESYLAHSKLLLMMQLNIIQFDGDRAKNFSSFFWYNYTISTPIDNQFKLIK